MPAPAAPDQPILYSDASTPVEASRGSDYLRLTWPTVTDADSYDIRFFNTVAGSTEIRSNVSPGRSFTELSENTLYQVSIRAVNDEGASSFSAALGILTRPPRPNAPKLLDLSNLPSGVVSPRGSDALFLAFDAVGNQYKYDFRLNSSDIRLEPGAKIDGLQPNTKYEIEVRARDASTGNNSLWSPSFSVITRPPRPNAPKLLDLVDLPLGVVSPRGPDTLFLAFDAVGNQYKYDFRLNSSDIRLEPGAKIDDLQPNTKYEIEVRARDASTENASLWSPSFSTITRPATPASLITPFFSRVIQWDITGADGDFIDIKQVKNSIESILVSEGPLKGSFEIQNNEPNTELKFSIRFVTPSDLVPEGLNRSFWSPEVVVVIKSSYPLVLYDTTEAAKYNSLGAQVRGNYSQRPPLR